MFSDTMINYLLPQILPSIIIILFLIYLATYRDHLLIILLILEAIVLILTVLTGLLLKKLLLFSILILLTLGACEASIGLRLLVLIRRTTGSDLIKTLNLNKFCKNSWNKSLGLVNQKWVTPFLLRALVYY